MTVSYSKYKKGRKPYVKRRYYKTKSYAGKSVYKFAKEMAQPGAQLAVSYLKSKLGLNTERHWLDTVESEFNPTTTLAAGGYALTIPQGDTSNDRNGSGVRLVSYEINGYVRSSHLATTAGSVRLIVVGQKVTNGNIIAASEVLDVTTNITSPYNMDTEGYTILYDNTFDMLGYGSNANQKNFHISVPIGNNWHLKWTDADTTGAAANVQKGYIRMFYMYQGFATTAPILSLYTRVKWVDN